MSRDDGLDKTTLLLLRAAIGLAAVHFPRSLVDGTTTVSSRDVGFLLDGHVDVWPEWSGLDARDTSRVVRLLRARRSEYADAELVRRTLRTGLDLDLFPACQLVADNDAELLIACTPGMPLRDFVDETLQALEKSSSVGRGLTRAAAAGAYHTTIRCPAGPGRSNRAVDQRYTIRDHSVAVDTKPPVLSTSPLLDDLRIPVTEVISLAETLDRLNSGPAYRANHVRKLCRRLHTQDGFLTLEDVLSFAAGEVRLLNAPTGIGKSVIMHVIACWMAMRGLVVTIVVPKNSDVLKLSHAVEADLKALGAEASVTPLMSPSAVFEELRKINRTRPAWDPTGQWTLERLGYGCALAAAAETEDRVDAWVPGGEPCTTLHASDSRSGVRRACPWRTTCGKFQLARAALTASVIVTSHANLHMGRLHLPVNDGHGITDRTTVEELVFRRSHLVVIDEIDAFQNDVLSQAARGLLLDQRGSSDTPLHKLEREFTDAADRLHRDVETSVRHMVSHSKFLATTYTAALRHGLIAATGSASRSPVTRHWLVPRRWDGALTAQLHGLAEGEPLTPDMVTAFRSVFPGEEPPTAGEAKLFTELREALAGLVEVGDDSRSLETCRQRLDEILTGPVPDEVARAKTINRLVQRTILERLRQHLRQFAFDAPHLTSAGVAAANDIAETFGPYGRWRVLPNGPLGRLLFAFSHHLDPSGQQPPRLNAAAFGGDPHIYATTLGDITALCRAGVRRAVLGLSATAYFPRAVHHHLHLDPHWWVTDDDPDGVRILPVYLSQRTGESRKPLRVSGIEGTRRDDALRSLAEVLWRSRLKTELDRLGLEDPQRARILLATTSYQGARMVAEGLLRAGAEPQRICLAVRPQTQGGDSDEEPPAFTWRELAADRLEEFPQLPGVDILIAPLARVQRGVNIIGADDKSALGSIWLLVRPVPVIDEPTELIAHINAHPLAPDPNDMALRDLSARRPADILDERKQSAGHYFEQIVTSLPYLRTLPKGVQLSIAAGIMNGIVQLVGRARRGGTPAVIHLADAAFHDPEGGPTFGTLVRQLRQHWRECGVLSRMQELYGATLAEFFRYADTEATLLEPSRGDDHA